MILPINRRPRTIPRPARPKMTGTELEQNIVDTAHIYGYIAFHQRPGLNRDGSWTSAIKYDGKGFPDLVLAGDKGILFIEVKGDGDKVRPDQEKWLTALRRGGARVHVWTPAEWHSGYITKALAAGPATR